MQTEETRLVAGETRVIGLGTLIWVLEGSVVAKNGSGHTQYTEGQSFVNAYPGCEVQAVENARLVEVPRPSDEGDAFGRRASAYAQRMEALNAEIGEQLAKDLSNGSGVWLDLGTGTGAMARILSERMPDATVVGIDQSAGMLAEARRRTFREKIWYVASALEQLDWPVDTFDGATALLSLHLLEKIEPVLAGLHRALKPGAPLLAALSAPDNPFLNLVMHNLTSPGRFFRYGQDKVLKAMKTWGFDIVRIETVNQSVSMPSPDEVGQLLKSIGAVAAAGLRADLTPFMPSVIVRKFSLVSAQKGKERS